MDWKRPMANRTRAAYVAIILQGIIVSYGHAQTTEAEWRVVNDITPTVIPSFLLETPNPFPTKPLPVAPPEPVVPLLDEAALREQQKGEVLQTLRNIMQDKTAFTANTEGVSFSGYMEGMNGRKVLYNGRWLREGDKIDVSVKGSNEVFKMLEKLKEFDPDMAKSMSTDFQQRVSNNRTELKIININKGKATLSDGQKTIDVTWEASGL